MASVAVAVHPRRRLGRGSFLLLAVVTSVTAVGIFVLLHKDVALPYATFRGACQRLRASGLPITEKDWFCHPIPWSAHAGFVVASLLAAAAFAVPSAILVASGRRSAALVPLVTIPFAAYPSQMVANELHWWEGTWPTGHVASLIVSIVLILVPAALVAVARRPTVAPSARVSLVGGAASAVACALAMIPIALVTDAALDRHFAELGPFFPISALLWPALAMASFAAILGTDRRWWPWVFAPAALFLSFAPATAFLVGPEGIQDRSLFGAVLPLFLVGLIWSAWRPLGAAITRVSGPWVSQVDVDPAAVTSGGSGRRARRALVLNALSAGLLCLSLIAFLGDPLPAHLGTALPTYLGERSAVENARLKLDLRLAIGAMDRFRAETGSYRGFDAEAGARYEPRLGWADRRDDATTPFWMWVVTATTDEARVAGLSSGGDAFCLQRTGGGLTLGSANGEFGSVLPAEALSLAIADCGATPWTASAVRVPDFMRMCNGLDRAGGYLICRMVQVLNVTELRKTKPDDA